MSQRLSIDQQRRSLQWWPFDGDKDGFDRVIEDRIVVGRRSARRCHNCGEPTVSGDHVRIVSAMYGNCWHQYRWCYECCEAASRLDDGGFDELVERCGRMLERLREPAP